MDSSVSASMHVHLPGNYMMMFHEIPKELYFHDTASHRSKISELATNSTFINTVMANKARYTMRETAGEDTSVAFKKVGYFCPQQEDPIYVLVRFSV